MIAANIAPPVCRSAKYHTINLKIKHLFPLFQANYFTEICIRLWKLYLRHLDCDHVRNYFGHARIICAAIVIFAHFLLTHLIDRGLENNIILRKLGCVRGWEWSQNVCMLLAQPAGHREVIIYPIDTNGDPHGLWQFIVHLRMNVGHHNMP